jgi:hypothetical protein
MDTEMKWRASFPYLCRFLALSLALVVAQLVYAYDFPLSEAAIRDAYFLGTRGPGEGTAFLAGYKRAIPELRAGKRVAV